MGRGGEGGRLKFFICFDRDCRTLKEKGTGTRDETRPTPLNIYYYTGERNKEGRADIWTDRKRNSQTEGQQAKMDNQEGRKERKKVGKRRERLLGRKPSWIKGPYAGKEEKEREGRFLYRNMFLL